jgi:hypothetical protein
MVAQYQDECRSQRGNFIRCRPRQLQKSQLEVEKRGSVLSANFERTIESDPGDRARLEANVVLRMAV